MYIYTISIQWRKKWEKVNYRIESSTSKRLLIMTIDLVHSEINIVKIFSSKHLLEIWLTIENQYLSYCLWVFTTDAVLLFRSYQAIFQWSFMIDFSSFNFYHQSFPIKFLQKPSAEKCNMLCKMKLTEKKNVFGKIFSYFICIWKKYLFWTSFE